MTYHINWKTNNKKTKHLPIYMHLQLKNNFGQCLDWLNVLLTCPALRENHVRIKQRNSQRLMWAAKVASRVKQQSDVDGHGARQDVVCCEYDIEGDLQGICIKNVVTIRTLMFTMRKLSSSAHLCVSLQGVSQLTVYHWSIIISLAALPFLQHEERALAIISS